MTWLLKWFASLSVMRAPSLGIGGCERSPLSSGMGRSPIGLHRQLGRAARTLVAALALSAAGLVGIVGYEGYSGTAIIPTKGDVPTLGFGSTTHADGRPVRMGDRTTPPKAIARTYLYLQDAEAEMKRTLEGVALHQAEYDVYVDWRYQYGGAAWAKSSMLRHLRAGDYAAACNSLLLYKFSAGFDCSTPGNRICPGVWTRQLERHQKCLAAQ